MATRDILKDDIIYSCLSYGVKKEVIKNGAHVMLVFSGAGGDDVHFLLHLCHHSFKKKEIRLLRCSSCPPSTRPTQCLAHLGQVSEPAWLWGM